MDPDVALAELKRLLETKPDLSQEELLNSVREQFQELDGWLAHGGFLPTSWSSSRGDGQ